MTWPFTGKKKETPVSSPLATIGRYKILKNELWPTRYPIRLNLRLLQQNRQKSHFRPKIKNRPELVKSQIFFKKSKSWKIKPAKMKIDESFG